MKVLLVLTKNNYPDPAADVNTFAQAMPYLAASLRQAGHEVVGVDINSIWCHGGAPLALEQAMRKAIAEHKPGLIGTGGLAGDYFFIRDTIRFARRLAPRTPVVLGGGIITYDTEFIFGNLQPDFGIVGEGELALVRLCDLLDSGGSLDSAPSLVHRRDGRMAVNPKHYVQDLDSLPFPDYTPFDFERHLSLNNKTNDYLAHTRNRPRIMPISVGRSCPFQCTFCCHRKGADYRTRSIDNVLAEAAHFYGMYRYNVLYVHDEVFSIQADKALQFARGVKRLKRSLGADFDWGCYLRVDGVNEDLLAEMKESGCVFIGYGLESASDKILRSMKKRITADHILRAINLTRKAGIGMHANFIFGDPAETPETIRRTADFYNKHCRDLTVYFFYITPYPGSEIFEQSVDRGLIPDREQYYKTVAHAKSGLNMTSMSDEEFYGLTRPIVSDIFCAKHAAVLSCRVLEDEPCDVDAPFEIRRKLCEINLRCPHCQREVTRVYPFRIRSGIRPQPVIHYCPLCHCRFIMEAAELMTPARDETNEYSTCAPYSIYHPFDARRYAGQSIPVPHLLEECRGYNVLRWADKYFAVAHALGPMDLTQISDELRSRFCADRTMIVAESLEQARGRIPAAPGAGAPQ